MTKALLQSLAIAGLAVAPLATAQADFATDARQVHETKAASIYGIRGVIKIDVTFNGQPAGNQETEIWSNGVVVADGLLMAAYTTLNPAVGGAGMNRPGVEIETELSEIKLVDASGEEYAGKLVLHDEDLGVAFIAIDPAGENASAFKASAVDLSKDVEAKHFDELVTLNRMSATARFTSLVKKATVAGVIERPRTKVILDGAAPGSSVFNTKGDFAGLIVAAKPTGGKPPFPHMLPNKYVRDLVKQAQEKQAELAK